MDCAFSFCNADAANIRNRADAGGGALRDIGVYPVVATGCEPLAARARIDWEAGIDATARGSLDFSGVTVAFTVSMRMAQRREMVFHGDNVDRERGLFAQFPPPPRPVGGLRKTGLREVASTTLYLNLRSVVRGEGPPDIERERP